ncbi:MAG TPA: o-succinylbenzoate synthase [Ktedonobacteraceae bacterium]
MQRSDLTREAGNIQAIYWYPYQIPFRSDFATAHGLLTMRTGAIVEVLTADGYHGIGEIAPLPEFSGESLANALEALPSITAQLQGSSLHAALTFLDESKHVPATVRSGLELALFDALGKQTGQTIAELLQTNSSHRKTHVPINAVVGASDVNEAVIQAGRAVEQGFSCIKLKMVGDEREQVERVAMVRETIGPDIQLRLDANEGWNFAQARNILKQCERYHVQYVEQPLPSAEIAGMRALQQEVTIPLAADEAINSLESAQNILAAHAASILILKPQLLGGLRNTQKIIDEAEKQGVSSVITSSIETGIGLVGVLHLAAACPTVTLPCGLATLALLEDDLLADDLSIQQGCLSVPTEPGLGVTLDRATLARYSTRTI